jgi:hypothetical protein
LLAGCAEPATRPILVPENSPEATKPAPAATVAVDPSTLPELADPLPPLDGGRLIVAGPKDWVLPPRDPRWLARFQRDSSTAYPSILIRAEAHDGPDLTAETATQLAEQVQAELEKDAKSGSAPQVQPLLIGEFAGVQYVDERRTRANRVERLVLITARGSRRYSVELQALSGTRDKYRNAALAVAHGLKIQSPDA